MKSLRLSACLCSLFLLTLAAHAQPRLTATTHVPAAVSRGSAHFVAQVPAGQRFSLAVSLPIRNENALDDLLAQMYDPKSASYQHYLSTNEFTERFGPSQEDYASLVAFAKANGLNVIESFSNRIVLDVEGSAADIEKAFHVSMGIYQHPIENRVFYAPDREPSLDLGVAVQHISGLDNFTLPQAKHVQAKNGLASQGTGSGPNGNFVASDMRAAYYGSGPLNGTGQSVALFEFAGYNVADVQTYFKNLNQPLNVPINGVSLNGVPLKCVYPACDDGEQAIDIEMAIGMAPALSQVVVYVGGQDVSIFNQMAVDNTSKQISCSWGFTDDESSLDPIFKQMAAQGQTVFVATGDNGSGTPGDVVWPSDDPYVMGVGGTDLVTTGPGGAWKSETGWVGSAGSIDKNGIPIPAYQKLNGVINSMNKGSTTLRNYPDVSAESNTNQYSCYDGVCNTGNGGTSYAAPEWAGYLALVNQQRVSKGLPTAGYINPAIYQIGVGKAYGSYFHDITSGNNGGYNAVTGYDLVTGWGSPAGRTSAK